MDEDGHGIATFINAHLRWLEKKSLSRNNIAFRELNRAFSNLIKEQMLIPSSTTENNQISLINPQRSTFALNLNLLLHNNSIGKINNQNFILQKHNGARIVFKANDSRVAVQIFVLFDDADGQDEG